jgi:hypothetical protein
MVPAQAAKIQEQFCRWIAMCGKRGATKSILLVERPGAFKTAQNDDS